MERAADGRRSDLDWMRLALVPAAILLTAARLFDTAPWLLKNRSVSPVFDLAVSVLGLVVIPLFSLVSAGALSCSLRRQDPGTFVAARVLRLFVPLVCGILILAPLQLYLASRASGEFSGSLPAFFQLFFGGPQGVGLRGSSAAGGLHLWYLPVLFVSSLALLPLSLTLECRAGRRFSAAFSAAFRAPGVLLVAGAIPAICNAFPPALSAFGAAAFGGWSPFFPIAAIVWGFMLFRDPAIRLQLVRQRYVMLAAALVVSALLILLPAAPLSASGPAALRGFAAWTLALALLGWGMALLAGSRPMPAGLSDRILPAYILGQPVILGLGWLLLPWNAGAGLKFALLSCAALLAVFLLTEGVRRLGILRFLFGLRPIVNPSGGKT